jgi:hypothetical protein
MKAIDSVAANLVSIAERPELRHAICLVDRIAYPPFMAHIDQAALWPLVYAEFPEFQLVLVDHVTGHHLAHANAVPFAWDGQYASLPSSAVELVELALRHKRGRRRATALGGLQVVVNPDHQRIGLSTPMLQATAATAATAGFRAVFAPIRPTHKTHYPLAPLSSYVTWQRPDGEPSTRGNVCTCASAPRRPASPSRG